MFEPLDFIYRMSVCEGDDLLYYVEILARGMLEDYQLTLATTSQVQHSISGSRALSLLISFYNVTSATVNLAYLCASLLL